jgi:hypothetical protein
MAYAIRLSTLIASMSLLAAVTAFAESGSYESVGSFASNYTKLEFAGQTITGGALQGAATIVRSSGGIFVEGANALLECIVYAKKSDAGMDLESPCIMTDAVGDKLYYISRRKAGDMSAGGEGHQDYAGGTGKFTGITGGCSYRTDYVSSKQAVSRQKCQWQKP